MTPRRTFLMMTAALMASLGAFGSGFALYEPSVVGHAMGGALVGKAMDASANFLNPATLTDLTNIWVTVGFITEHPRGVVRGTTNGQPWEGGDQTMDPGLFWLPHFQLATPLPADFTFGLSGSAEYGLGTEYTRGWAMAWSARETIVQGYVLNPNLAYKVTDKWSVAVGLRWLYFDFEQYKDPNGSGVVYHPVYKTMPIGTYSYSGEYHLHGDNRWESFGWVIGTKYDILDNLSVGLVYKSAIDAKIRGETTMQQTSMTVSNPATEAGVRQTLAQKMASYNGSADADMRLPQSVTAGLNWDITSEHHLGFATSWTQWSEFDTLIFNVKPTPSPVYLNWNDTWRSSLGYAWDFHEDWTWMVSYVFDEDCCLSKDQSSAMLPPAHRNIATTGFKWNIWRNLDLALDYSCIFMDGGSFDTKDSSGNDYHLETCRGFCHAVGFSASYRF